MKSGEIDDKFVSEFLKTDIEDIRQFSKIILEQYAKQGERILNSAYPISALAGQLQSSVFFLPEGAIKHYEHR